MKRAKRSRKGRPTPPAAVTSAQKIGPILRWISVAVAAIGVFWMPWQVGYAKPAIGESYELGFNNHVAIIALATAIILATAGCFLSASRPAACEWFQANPRFFPPWKEARAEYWILIVIATAMAAADLIWSMYIVDPAWCDARGAVFGMDLVSVGQVPYRDFMYNYGPATIYLPFWLSRLTGGLISFENSYTASLLLFSTLGFMALFAILQSLEMPKQSRPLVFIIVSLGWTCITLASQYTPLRYGIVPIAVLFLDAVARRESGSGTGPLVRIGLAAAIGAAPCLGISPELGIAGAAAVVTYGFMMLLRRAPGRALACWIGAAAAFAATLVIFPGYLDSVFAFTSGGSNIPIYPNLHNLCLVTISLMIFPALIASALTNPGEARAPLAISLAAGGGMLLVGAFGRADPGHVVSYGLTPGLIMFAVAAAAGMVPFRMWTAAYAILFVGLPQLSYWNTYVVNFTGSIQMHQFYAAHPDLVATWKKQWDALRLSNPHGREIYWSKVLPYPVELEQITSKGRMLLTNSNENNLWLARFLLMQNPSPQEYFNAYSQGAATREQIARKVRDDEAYRFLIMPENTFASQGGTINLEAYGRYTSEFLSKLLLFPVSPELKNAPYLPDADYARAILANYKPIGRYSSYIILEKTANAAGSAR